MNLVLGATLGGIVAALLGRDAVFILNALSFLISALLVTGMNFAEPHADAAGPLRHAGVVRLLADSRGSALHPGATGIGRHRVRQGRQPGHRSELGAVHGDGAEIFPGALAQYGSAARRDAGHELAARSARTGVPHRTAIQRALGGPSGSAPAAGNSSTDTW